MADDKTISITIDAVTVGVKKGVDEAVAKIKELEAAAEKAGTATSNAMADAGKNIEASTVPAIGRLAGIITDLVNPVGLATTAVTALGAALFAYATSGSDKLLTLNEVMDRHAQAIKSLGAAYPEATKGLDKLAKESDSVIETRLLGNIANLEEKLASMSSSLVNKLGSVGASLNSLSFEFGGVVEQSAIADKEFKAFQGALDGLYASIKSGNPDINTFNSEVSRIAREAGNTPEILRLAGDVLALGKDVLATAGDFQVAIQALKNYRDEASGAAGAVRNFNSAINQLKALDPTKISALVQAETAYQKALSDTNLDLVQRKEIFDQYMKTVEGINKAEAAKQKPAAAPVEDDGMSAQMARRMQFIIDSTLTEEQLLVARYERNRLLLQEAFAIELADSALHGEAKAALKAEQDAKIEALDAKHQQNMARMQAAADARTLGNMSSTFGKIASIIESGGKKGSAAAKAFYIAQAIMSTFSAATQAMADPTLITPFQKFAAYAAIATKGLAAVASIRSVNPSGGGGGGGAGAAAAAPAAAPAPTTTFQFTMSNDPMGFGEKFARQFIDQLNSTQRNGGQIRGVLA